jgi:hypothetical protein
VLAWQLQRLLGMNEDLLQATASLQSQWIRSMRQLGREKQHMRLEP